MRKLEEGITETVFEKTPEGLKKVTKEIIRVEPATGQEEFVAFLEKELGPVIGILAKSGTENAWRTIAETIGTILEANKMLPISGRVEISPQIRANIKRILEKQ